MEIEMHTVIVTVWRLPFF